MDWYLTLAATIALAGGWRDALSAPTPKKSEPTTKSCMCSELCVCGCNLGKKCKCQVTHGAASSSNVVPSDYRPATVFPVLGPVIRFVTPGGVRPANC